MEVSAFAAFNHINTFVHPQATFIDGSGEEEPFFSKGLKNRAVSLGRTVIELPSDAEQSLMWVTLLDSASLSGMFSGIPGGNLTKYVQPGIRSALTLWCTPNPRLLGL